MTNGTGFPRNVLQFMIRAATIPIRMPSRYREIITSARCVGKNAAVKNA